MSNSPWSRARSAGIADDIGFEIKGQELRFIELELDPGERPFTTAFTHNGFGKAHVAFSAPVPGVILPIKLDKHGGTLLGGLGNLLDGDRTGFSAPVSHPRAPSRHVIGTPSTGADHDCQAQSLRRRPRRHEAVDRPVERGQR